MTCCQCQGIEIEFNPAEATRKLQAYRQKGLAGTTRQLVEALIAKGVAGMSLLDIGGGIGVIQHELLNAGASDVISVEASSAYFDMARQEAERRGLSGRIRAYRGNFVELARDIPSADVVTLDRVICCYHDMPALVGLSAARARKLYALVYPRDTWWTKLGVWLINGLYFLQGSPFRTFVHPTPAVESILHTHGLQRSFHRATLLWQVVVYAKT